MNHPWIRSRSATYSCEFEMAVEGVNNNNTTDSGDGIDIQSDAAQVDTAVGDMSIQDEESTGSDSTAATTSSLKPNSTITFPKIENTSSSSTTTTTTSTPPPLSTSILATEKLPPANGSHSPTNTRQVRNSVGMPSSVSPNKAITTSKRPRFNRTRSDLPSSTTQLRTSGMNKSSTVSPRLPKESKLRTKAGSSGSGDGNLRSARSVGSSSPRRKAGE